MIRAMVDPMEYPIHLPATGFILWLTAQLREQGIRMKGPVFTLFDDADSLMSSLERPWTIFRMHDGTIVVEQQDESFQAEILMDGLARPEWS